MIASVRGRRIAQSPHPFGLMISSDTAAVQLDDPSLARPKGWSVRRLVGPVAVALALFSAFLTFIVLTGLTPIEPKRDVVYGFLLINAATILVLVGIIAREVWKVVQARRRGSAAAPARSARFRGG